MNWCLKIMTMSSISDISLCGLKNSQNVKFQLLSGSFIFDFDVSIAGNSHLYKALLFSNNNNRW
jgi:hypothetical protein